MAIFKNVLCPYCLNKLGSSDILRRCNICGTDLPSGLLQMKPPKCTSESCVGLGTDCRCRYCQATLPADFLKYDGYLRFSLLGPTGAGKTNFLTTMLNELRCSIDNPWVPSNIDQDTLAYFEENRRMIYDEHTPVSATIAGQNPPPQLWRIRAKDRAGKWHIPTYSMTIFDGAGENCTNIDPRISRYINGSKTLIIMVDPTSLKSVKNSVSSDILNWSRTAEHYGEVEADMIVKIADYIRNNCGWAPGRLIDKHIAVVFTKIDILKNEFLSGRTMLPSPHLDAKGFVKEDADAVDKEIRSWLIRNHEINMLNMIDTNFDPRKVHFFGISSFGEPPLGVSSVSDVKPHRVLDPLVWMLAQEGIAKTI